MRTLVTLGQVQSLGLVQCIRSKSDHNVNQIMQPEVNTCGDSYLPHLCADIKVERERAEDCQQLIQTDRSTQWLQTILKCLNNVN